MPTISSDAPVEALTSMDIEPPDCTASVLLTKSSAKPGPGEMVPAALTETGPVNTPVPVNVPPVTEMGFDMLPFTSSVPLLIVVVPVQLFVPVKITVPCHRVRLPAPLIGPLTVSTRFGAMAQFCDAPNTNAELMVALLEADNMSIPPELMVRELPEMLIGPVSCMDKLFTVVSCPKVVLKFPILGNEKTTSLAEVGTVFDSQLPLSAQLAELAPVQ